MKRVKHSQENEMSNKDFLIWVIVLMAVMFSAFFCLVGIISLFM